jgi:hypothetical protein
MAVPQHIATVLGLDLGRVHTRATLFGIIQGKYRALGSGTALTALGAGMHLGRGVGETLKSLQERCEHPFLKDSGGLILPLDRMGRGVDRVALLASAGPQMTASLLGLSGAGSIKAGRALLGGLPLQMVDALGVGELADEAKVIERLVKTRPEIVVIAGGEDAGAEVSIRRWMEVLRTACRLMPSSSQPVIVYAGNPTLESMAMRRLEPVGKLYVVPNIQPAYGEYDLVPAQIAIEGEILRRWKAALPGLPGLCDLARDLNGITYRAQDRMVHYLGQSKRIDGAGLEKTGVLAVDLGGQSTTLSGSLGSLAGSVVQNKFSDVCDASWVSTRHAVYEWTGEPITLDTADQFLCNYELVPVLVPETPTELALSQSFARFRLRRALTQFAEIYPWFDYHPDRGLQGHYEPIIVSGAVLTHAPNPGGALLTLLDGLQPCGITTFVLDRHHLLPLLGKIGEIEPVLPVQVLASAAFENLGTVVSATGDLPQGKLALTVHVETESGKIYAVDVLQGSLRRLVIPTGEEAVLEFVPHQKVDIGFGGAGQGGRLKVTGGVLGVVIDARGRPVQLPDQPQERVERLQEWLRTMGAEHA